MQHRNIILKESIPSGAIHRHRPHPNEATSQPESARAADYRQLPARRLIRVMAHNIKRAPIVPPSGKHEIERHVKTHILQRGESKETLSPTHYRGVRPGQRPHRVVEHRHEPEECRRGKRRVGPSHLDI